MVVASIKRAVREVFHQHVFFAKEEEVHRALAASLEPHEWKPRLRFAPARHPVAGPTSEDRRRLEVEGKSAVLDVCDKKDAAVLDLLWHSHEGPVALEVKFRNMPSWSGKLRGERLQTKSSSDTYGRGVLLDIHRLERIEDVYKGTGSWKPARRFSLFVTNDRKYWTGVEGRQTHFALTDGTTIPARHNVAYTQPSVDTRWVTYPPFQLAGSYKFAWEDVGNDVTAFERSITDGRVWPAARMLLVEVHGQ